MVLNQIVKRRAALLALELEACDARPTDAQWFDILQ